MTIPGRFTGSEDEVHAAASAATGLYDFGPEAQYRSGLTALLEALDHGPRFAPGGREFAFGNVVGILVARLTTQRGFAERPQVAIQSIVRPLVITGIPRTGTTALHKLLSVDDQFQGLERWLTAFPMPRPARSTWESNPSYQATVAGIEAFFAGAPNMRAAHDMVASDVDECLEVLKQNFCSNTFGSAFRVPNYDDWWRKQDEFPSYERFSNVLKLVAANEPAKPWLLKNPGHLAELNALLKLFPDACIVQTHRDPVRALPSLCSVLAQSRGITEGDRVVTSELGERELNYWHAAATRAMSVSAGRPGQFIDIRNDELHRNPMGVVERIYAQFGYTLSDATADRMKERIRANPEGRHGEHRYTLEEFGLSEPMVRDKFSDYRQRYGFDGAT